MIREVIENSDLSWSEIAKIYGIPQKTMEKWYYGTREPPEYVSRLLERVLREDGRTSG
jgi:DNA-binding transcriptional regulator YiaG